MPQTERPLPANFLFPYMRSIPSAYMGPGPDNSTAYGNTLEAREWVRDYIRLLQKALMEALGDAPR